MNTHPVDEDKFRSAVAMILSGFDTGVFVRSTDGDHDPAWAIRLFPYLQALAVAKQALEAGSEAPPLSPQQEKICECGHHFAWHVTTVLSTSSESRMYCAKCACIDFRPASVAPLPPADAPNLPTLIADMRGAAAMYRRIAETGSQCSAKDVNIAAAQSLDAFADRLAASGAPPQQEKQK